MSSPKLPETETLVGLRLRTARWAIVIGWLTLIALATSLTIPHALRGLPLDLTLWALVALAAVVNTFLTVAVLQRPQILTPKVFAAWMAGVALFGAAIMLLQEDAVAGLLMGLMAILVAGVTLSWRGLVPIFLAVVIAYVTSEVQAGTSGTHMWIHILAIGGVAALAALVGNEQRRLVQLETEHATTARLRKAMLAETHHRIKNNLQMVSDLLLLQAHEDTGESFEHLVGRAVTRLRALAAIDDILAAEDEGMTRLEPMVRSVANLLAGECQGVRVRVDVEEDLHLPDESAARVAQVAAELLTNAIQHAFPDHSPGNVTLDLGSLDGHGVLIVEDDGIGVASAAPGLGLRLVRTLVEDGLRGSLWMETDGGTRVTVRFPLADPDRPKEVGESARAHS